MPGVLLASARSPRVQASPSGWSHCSASSALSLPPAGLRSGRRAQGALAYIAEVAMFIQVIQGKVADESSLRR